MKNKENNKLKELAKDIFQAERNIENNMDVEKNKNFIEETLLSLSILEILELDDYLAKMF